MDTGAAIVTFLVLRYDKWGLPESPKVRAETVVLENQPDVRLAEIKY